VNVFADSRMLNNKLRMKVFTALTLILVSLSATTGNGQSSRLPQRRSTSPFVQPSADEATRAWPSFWRVIVPAINTRNRAALKSMMPREFFDGLEIVTPDEWFKFVDSQRLWRDLQKNFRGRTITYRGQAVPTRLTRDRTLYFEFRNGRWYFAGVMGD
jgi:hypothetical protein